MNEFFLLMNSERCNKIHQCDSDMHLIKVMQALGLHGNNLFRYYVIPVFEKLNLTDQNSFDVFFPL